MVLARLESCGSSPNRRNDSVRDENRTFAMRGHRRTQSTTGFFSPGNHSHSDKEASPTKNAQQKVFGVVSKFLHTIVSCYPKLDRKFKHFDPEAPSELHILDLPNEVLTNIFSYNHARDLCSIRAVNRRFRELVDSGSSSFSRLDIINGFKITPDPGSTEYVILWRLKSALRSKSLRVYLHDLPRFLRRFAVCHELRVVQVLLDELMLEALEAAHYKCIDVLSIDRLGSVQPDRLSALLHKISPSRVLHLDTADPNSSAWLSSHLLVNLPTRSVSLGGSAVFNLLDDDFLLHLVTSEVLSRRDISLPRTSITHYGITAAAEAFYDNCCELSEEAYALQAVPIIRTVVLLPGTKLIDVHKILIPPRMKDQCKIWKHPHAENFAIEVRVEMMNLHIAVCYPRLPVTPTADQ